MDVKIEFNKIETLWNVNIQNKLHIYSLKIKKQNK